MNRAAFVTLATLLLAGCGFRVGYRSARVPGESGLYGGPWVALATSTAEKTAAVGTDPYVVLAADYQFAPGRDFATVGGGLASAPHALGWHNALTFQVAFEPWHGMGVHLSLCDGYGNWGTVVACGRWSSKGYWGFDLGAGLSPTRLGADVHESCRDGSCDDGDGWDD